MVGVHERQRRRASRLAVGLRSLGAGWGAVCYGRALHLPPAALTPRIYPPDHAVVAGLKPFRRRLYLQRAAVIAVRALGLAIICAVAVLIVRITGVAVPLPLAPSIAAGFGLLVGVGVIIAQRPSTAQMAHALDQRLGLHEQIGSALDLDPTEGRLAALLHQRAAVSLRDANHEYVLPWPSLRRERFWLICLGVLVAISALVAVNAPLARRSVAVATPGAASARRGATLNHRAAAGSGALKLVALGPGGQARLLNGAHAQAGRRGATRTRSGANTGGSGHAGSSNGLRLQTGQARSGGRTAGPGARTGAPSASAGKTGAAGRAGGQRAGLHLTAGKNSATGGVLSPAQQALQNLQNSISSAQSPPPGATYRNASNNQGNSAPRNAQGQGRSGAGRQGASRRNAQGQGRSGGRKGNGNASSQSGNSSSPENTSRGPNQPYGLPGNNGEDARFGRRPGGGRGIDGVNPYGASPNNRDSSSARLSDNEGITLNGAAGKGGRMILTVGAPNRAPGLGGASYGATTNAVITVPGYVAPDSNTVSPDDRALIRQYFSPNSN